MIDSFGEAKECCGVSPIYRSIDDFKHHTKTYTLKCPSCGREVKVIREIGKLAPKKAILRLYDTWNESLRGLEYEQ